MLIVGLIIAVIRVFRHKNDKKNFFALAIFVVTAVTIIFFPFRMAKVKLELPLYEEKRQQIVEMVAKGELATDDIGNA